MGADEARLAVNAGDACQERLYALLLSALSGSLSVAMCGAGNSPAEL